jgi:hypothetical protein
MPATPCPGSPGCRCAYCYGLREHMQALTGRDYGLPATFIPWRAESEPTVVQFRPRETAPQPWIPRPARRSAA